MGVGLRVYCPVQCTQYTLKVLVSTLKESSFLGLDYDISMNLLMLSLGNVFPCCICNTTTAVRLGHGSYIRW